MIVVADTSVILNLCCVQHEFLLQKIFNRVLVPHEVTDEFTTLVKGEPRFSGLKLPAWIETVSGPKPLPDKLVHPRLDPGESAAIALCLSEKADALLIDETFGREIAVRLGIRVVGILGILIVAKHRGLTSSVKVLLDRLQSEAGFWISADLRAYVLQLAGE